MGIKEKQMTGRPSKYNKDIDKKVVEYLVNCEAQDTVPTAAGLAVHLEVAKSTIYKWAEEHEAFSDTLGKINSIQEQKLLDKGLKNEYNSTIVKLMLANHGYSDKQQIDQHNTGNVKVEVVNFGDGND